MNKRIKKIFMRLLTTVISVCTLMNNLSFPIKSEAIETKYQFCYVHFNTDDSSVDKYAKILKSGNIVYINLEDFLSLTNMVTLHNSQINFAALPDGIRKNTSKIDDVFFLTKKNVNLTWVFANGSSNAYCVSQYEGITSTELGGEVVFLGESNAEKYIPFQTLLSIFNIQYVINESSIEILDGYYTSKDYFHMEFLKNYQTNNLNVLHSVYGVAGKFFDIYGRRLDDYANFNFKDLENLSSEIIGNTVNENDFKKLTALYCLPDQTENDKLTDVSQLTYNSALPLLHSIASKHNGKKVDNSESALKFFNDFCDLNEYLEVNGNRVSTDTLKTVFGSNLNGNVSKYESINDNLDSLGKSITIASKFLETSIDLVSISDEISNSNDEMVNSLDLYCDYHLKTNVEDNFNNFDNIAMSNGITSDGIEIFKKYMDIYKNDSSQIQYCVDTVAKGIYETYENIGWDVVIDTLATADPTGTFKIIKTVKFGLGVANSIYSLTTWLMNDTTGVFDKFEASKLSLYLYSMEKDSNQLINDLKENFSEYYSENNSFYSDYAQLEYIRLKSFYLSNLANAEIYKNEIKELQADTSADHSKEIKFYQEKMALSEKNAEEICQLMISVLKSKNQLIITTIYSETADAELLSSNAIYQTINGTVQDSSGNIVNNVAVTFKSATEEHTINSDEFPVYLKPNDYDIIISDSRYNQYTSKITLDEFGAVSVEIVLEENFENLYYKFIEEELIPKYGVSELKNLTIDYTLSVDHNANSPDYSDWYGVISADICDINGKQNLLTVALKETNRKPHLIFELYGYDENVHLIDTYDLEMNEYTTGFNVGWSDGYLCSSYSWHFNYISSRYGSIDTLLKVNANGFTQCFELWNSYSMGGAMRLYNAVSEKIYFDTDGSSMDGITESIEVIKNDLSSLGISKYEIGCEDYSESFVFNIIFTNEICDFNIYEEYGEPQDYTDLRSHITVKETENQTWKQLYAEELRAYMNSDRYSSDAMFDLCDIDIDGIPELFISTGISHGSSCLAHTIVNDTVRDISNEYGYGSWGKAKYSKSKKILLSNFNGDGASISEYYQIENGKLVCSLKARSDSADVGVENAAYRINDVIVTEKEYDEAVSKYESDDYVSVGRKYKLDSETINSVLLNDSPQEAKDIYSWTSEMIANAVNNYLSANWNNEYQYYVFDTELVEDVDVWHALIRWNGSNSANVITGSECTINKASGEVEISFNGKAYEWFNIHDYSYDSQVASDIFPLTGTVSTEEDRLNVRQAPSTEAEIIGKLEKGSTVTIISEANGWCEIEYNGGVGYVSKEFIEVESCDEDIIGGYAKPVIYLYPEEKTDISVKVKFKNGDFTCTYPEYENGWNVTAYPDGKIINKADSDEYSYLYWEGEGEIKYDFSSGFVVKKEDTAKFLKEKLSYMGLTPKEYNEFIVYWLPIMQKNEYNLISFQMENYDESAKLEISPEPDSILRVFMAFKGTPKNTIIPEQELEQFNRSGFTVIEWGGTEV